jgi:beta-lactamase regulating signal transducer with metallopeptidase domain
MGLVLLFYHILLSREKTYQINRWYLLIGLLFSLTIPFMPVGIADSMLTGSSTTEISQVISKGIGDTNAESVLGISESSTGINAAEETSSFEWIYSLLLCLYSIVTLILSARMIRHLYRMQLKAMKNPAIIFEGHKVVLLDEDVVPHTFCKTIFVNEDQYKKGAISDEVMIHELIHARQNHSLDILIAETLKTISWFNPVLYFYKTAMQVNHEYIADDKVLSKGADIADYQRLLLNMRTDKSARYLSTGLNFNITKKRFKMMTLKDSTYRSSLKTALIIPFFLVLGITFGCEPASMEKDNKIEKISVEIADAKTIKINGETVSASQFGKAFSALSFDPKQTIIDIKMHMKAPTGLFNDVQEVLHESGALKINYTAVQSDKPQAENAWVVNAEGRNILDFYVNAEGEIVVNQNPASLSLAKRLVREFLTNNGKSAGLSERPEDAIIAIRTDKQTPYKTYNNALEKVFEVYDELRNQASMDVFDKPFQALDEGSEERNKIKDMYPKKISIKEPANS